MKKILTDKRIIGLLSIILLAVIVIVIKSSISTEDSSILRRQVVDNLSFENAELKCEGNTCTFEVDVYNDSKEAYNLKNIKMSFKQEDGSIETLLGYIGEKLESDEGRKITASIDKDISNSTDIEYEIVK